MRATVTAALAALLVVATGVAAQANALPSTEVKVDLVGLSVVAILLLLIALFWSAAKRGLSCLDLITDKGSGKMSLTKVANVVGLLVASWVVMRMAIDKDLRWDVFIGYLTYCASTHAFSSYLSAKFRPGEKSPSEERP